MKRKIIFCCAILMTLLQFSFLNSFSLEGQVTVGDINGDGYVDSIDYVFFFKQKTAYEIS